MSVTRMRTKASPLPNAGTTRGSDRPAIAALTGLRFGAALLVVLHHYFAFFRYGIADAQPAPSILGMFQLALANAAIDGYLAVNVFFILSGFILTYSYLSAQRRLRVSRKEYWMARVARIYPVYLVALVVAAFPVWWTHAAADHTVPTALAAIFLVQAWFPHAAIAWNGPGWTLSVEAFFYLLFPFIVPTFARLRRRTLLVALPLLWGLCLLPAILYVAINPDRLVNPWYGAPIEGSWLAFIQYLPLARLPEFLLGVVASCLFMFHRTPSASGRWSGPAFVAVLAAFALSPLFPVPLVRAGLFDPLFVWLIYALAFQRGRLTRLLSAPLMILLGEASYALYLLHYPLWSWLSHWLPVPAASRAGNLWADAPLFIAYITGSVAVSLAVFLTIERPARIAIRRAISLHRQPSRPQEQTPPPCARGSANSGVADPEVALYRP